MTQRRRHNRREPIHILGQLVKPKTAKEARLAKLTNKADCKHCDGPIIMRNGNWHRKSDIPVYHFAEPKKTA
jgi:hypothetical protein